jgi:hypothetical protein
MVPPSARVVSLGVQTEPTPSLLMGALVGEQKLPVLPEVPPVLLPERHWQVCGSQPSPSWVHGSHAEPQPEVPVLPVVVAPLVPVKPVDPREVPLLPPVLPVVPGVTQAQVEGLQPRPALRQGEQSQPVVPEVPPVEEVVEVVVEAAVVPELPRVPLEVPWVP